MKHIAIIGESAGGVIIFEFLIVFNKGENDSPRILEASLRVIFSPRSSASLTG